VPYPYKNCDELLAQCRLNQLNISEVVLANEAALAGCEEAEQRAIGIADLTAKTIGRIGGRPTLLEDGVRRWGLMVNDVGTGTGADPAPGHVTQR